MLITSLAIDQLHEAPWNPNEMDEATRELLTESIARYGVVTPLVVRPRDGGYEVLSGSQRLGVLTALEHKEAPCVVVEVDDAQAMLLAQALNTIHGEDDVGLKAELMRTVLDHVSQGSVLSLLPETMESLAALSTLGQEDMGTYLQQWEHARNSRLRHLTFQLAESQRDLVEQALDKAGEGAVPDDGNPNRKGNALYAICRAYLDREVGQ